MADKKLAQRDKRYRENFFKKTIHSILVGILIGLSYLPFWILYGISDFFYLLVRFIIKYRYKVIKENLEYAFPEKSTDEIQTLINRFYRHFCDMFIEVIKAYSVSKKKLEKRYRLKSSKIYDEAYKNGTSIIALGMHYNNWEWGGFLGTVVHHKSYLLYNPIRGNQAFERFINHVRTRWGGNTVPVHLSRRIVLQFGKGEIPETIWLGADQAPPPTSKFWTMFFNREAPFFSGPEKIAQVSNQPVYLHVTRKVKRGHYEVDFIPLIEKPREVEANEILLMYIKKVEEIVREDPAYYLWSHRRWKHSRPQGIELIQ